MYINNFYPSWRFGIIIIIITIWTTAIGYQIHPSDDNLDNPLARTFCPSHPHRPKHHKQTSQFLYLGSIYMLICEYFPSRRSDPVGMDISILTMIYVSCFLPYHRPSHHHSHPPLHRNNIDDGRCCTYYGEWKIHPWVTNNYIIIRAPPPL